MEIKARAAIYIRVSTREQATDDKVSLEVQQRECEAYCRRKGYEAVRSPYVDVQSGTDSRKERASFEQMLGDARKGAFDIIVAWRPDRLFRSLWPAARLKTGYGRHRCGRGDRDTAHGQEHAGPVGLGCRAGDSEHQGKDDDGTGIHGQSRQARDRKSPLRVQVRLVHQTAATR